LPASLGDIAADGSATATLTFPSTAGISGARVIEKLAGTYSAGSFTTSIRAVLP